MAAESFGRAARADRAIAMGTVKSIEMEEADL